MLFLRRARKQRSEDGDLAYWNNFASRNGINHDSLLSKAVEIRDADTRTESLGFYLEYSAEEHMGGGSVWDMQNEDDFQAGVEAEKRWLFW